MSAHVGASPFSGFTLIVVLFILLVLVGCACYPAVW